MTPTVIELVPIEVDVREPDLLPAIDPNEPLVPVPVAATAEEQLIAMTLATCISPDTRRSYSLYLHRYLASEQPLTREGVALFMQSRREAGASTSSAAGCLSAIRKLANEAYLRGLITFEVLHGITSIKAEKHQRTRAGMWLTLAQVEQLLALPDRTTYWGKRDACILSTLVSCGLRRREIAAMTWDFYQMREGRMCLVDFVGKGRKRRTIPIPRWAQVDIDVWFEASRNPPAENEPSTWEPAHSRCAVDKTLITGGLGYEGLYSLVSAYGKRIGVRLAPHDLRRTLAKLLHKNGASLDQIQHTLGHQSIATTEIYLGSTLELESGAAAVDRLALRSAHAPLTKSSKSSINQGQEARS